MKIKTSELTGAALDWAVTSIEYPDTTDLVFTNFGGQCLYSTDWAEGGPIVEREQIATSYLGNKWMATKTRYDEWPTDAEVGPTLLSAAMRCYVASKLGEEVEIPPELIA